MLYTPHFLTGAAIVKLVPNPVIGLPLAFASHILLDLTPHNDFDLKPGVTLKVFFHEFPKKRRNIILAVMGADYLLTAISFVWIVLTYHNYWWVIGGIVGILPDAIEQFLMIFGVALPGWQDKLQWRVSAKYGFIGYPVVSMIALYLLIY